MPRRTTSGPATVFALRSKERSPISTPSGDASSGAAGSSWRSAFRRQRLSPSARSSSSTWVKVHVARPRWVPAAGVARGRGGVVAGRGHGLQGEDAHRGGGELAGEGDVLLGGEGDAAAEHLPEVALP